MRILITSDWYVPAVNGVVTSVLNLSEELRKLGHEVRILTLSARGLPYQEGDVYYVPSISGEMVYKNARIGPIPDLLTLYTVEKWKPDIIHSQCELSTFVWAWVLSRHYKIPIVHTYHTMYEYYTRYFIANERLGIAMVRGGSRFVLARTQMVIVPTAKVRSLLLEYGVTRPIRVVPTGIRMEQYLQKDAQQTEALRRQLGLSSEKLILLTAGRVTREKNMDGLLRLLAGSDHSGMKLVIVGDGPYRAELEDLCGKLGLKESVVFTGMVDPQQMPLYYSLGDLYVGASVSETQGLTYVEAMAAGLAMLCRRDGALEGLVQDGVNGWQFDTAAEFSMYLQALKNDPERRRTMAAQSRRIAQEGWSTEVFARRVLEVYKEALSLPPAQPRRRVYHRIAGHLRGLERRISQEMGELMERSPDK